MSGFGEKAMACLRLAALDKMSGAWRASYDEAVTRFSEKALLRTFEKLVARGYIECGVSARTGWLTDKGKSALAVSESR